MGKIFDDLSYATPKHLYVGAPVEEIKAFNAQKSKDYTEARGTKDALDIALNNLDVRDIDYNTKKNYLQGLKSRLQETVDNGDWQNAKYAVTDEVKKFQTDVLLNAAQRERAKELSFNKNLKDRVDKGDLSQKHANWSKANTQNTAVKLNPDGTVGGGFNGYGVLDDKKITKEIYDQADKRIKDWKENKVLKAGGKEYMRAGNGQYFVKGSNEYVDPSEVRNALVNEIKNSYGDFLQQEKAVDNFNLKGGQNRNIELSDFQRGLGLNSTNDILQAKGLSDFDIKQMQNSNNPKIKQQAEIAKNERRALEAKLSTPEGRDEVYNDLYDRNQMNKYVQGATNKASYDKEDADWMLDHFALENLKHKHEKALKEIEQQAPPSNIHALEQYTLKDNEGFNSSLNDYNKQISDIKAKLQTNLPTIEKNALLNQLSDVQNKASMAYNVKSQAIKNLGETSPELVEKYITFGLMTNDGNKGLIDEVLNNPAKYTSQLGGYVRQLKNKIDFNMKNSKGVNANFSDLNPVTNAEIKTLKILIDKQKDKDFLYKAIVSSASNLKDDSYGIKVLGSSNYKLADNVKNDLLEAENKALEKNNVNLAYTTKTYGVTKELKEESDALTNLFRNQETTATRNNLNWDKFIQDQELVDEKGNPIKGVENKDIEVFPEINWDKGEKTVRINVLNAYTQGDKGQKNHASWSFTPGDEEGVATTLREMGHKLIKSDKPDAKNAGREMLAFDMYGKPLKYFNPKVMGEKAYTDIPTADGHVATIMAKKSKSGNTFEVYKVMKDKDGKPIEATAQPLNLKVPNESNTRHDFKSSKDLAEALYYSQLEQ